MSEEHVETVRALYGELSHGDFSGFAELPDDFEFVTSPEVPDAGTYRGAAASRWMTTWVDSFDELKMEASEFIDGGDKVVFTIFQRGRPRGSGGLIEGRWWQVVTFREGEMVRVETFQERTQALEAAGLPE